jgi:phosphoribosylformylglycinamidine synthase
VRNASEQFEARLTMVEVRRAHRCSSRHGRLALPIAVAHGEGRAEFASPRRPVQRVRCTR